MLSITRSIYLLSNGQFEGGVEHRYHSKREKAKERNDTMINRLYHNVMQSIMQILAGERVTRLRVLGWLMAGLYLSNRPHSNRLASQIVGSAKKLSKAKRLRRWLSNAKVRVRGWYRPVAIGLIEQALQARGELRLIVDGTRIGWGHPLLRVALAYRRRALPIAWTWTRHRRGHRCARKQCALLSDVKNLIPDQKRVILRGDSEFGAVPVLRQLEKWGWHYVIRQTGKHTWRSPEQTTWQRFDALLTRGQRAWRPQVWFCQTKPSLTNLVACWHPSEARPWRLTTNLADPALALRLYSRRMWIEGMFGDWKDHGFEIEALRLRHFARLSRFTLAVALWYVWLIAFASSIVKQGRRHFVDRPDPPQLSYFRIGFDFLQRCLTHGLPFSFRLLPYY
jgi:hypothetical protein